MKLGVENLSRCSNKIESVGFRNVRIISLSYYKSDVTITSL